MTPFQERIFLKDNQPRRLFHTHIQTAPLYGNSTDLQYFFVEVAVGSDKQKQTLIVDTGSGIACFPCKNYCQQCGSHINDYFEVDKSTSKYLYNCQKDSCTC